MTNRERLKRAIDNMERTEICLEIFDRTFDQAREALKAALKDGAWPYGGLTREVTYQLKDALAAMEDAGR